MTKKIFLATTIFLYSCNLFGSPDKNKVEETLDNLHYFASKANAQNYFSLFRNDAVFIGTDANETWSLTQFKAYVEPYFAKGVGWTYTPKRRNIYFSQTKDVAWFDEILMSEKYGTSRGTGVLEKEDNTWKVVQYHLTFPIPNELAEELTQKIKAFEQKAN